jgi:hypothetical protein
MKEVKASALIQILIFSLFIGVFFLLFLILPDKGFSERENRELAAAPKFSFESLFADSSDNNSFTKKFEKYTTDQFPFRDSWITMKAASELAIGKKENNGVYLGKNETLIEEFVTPDAELLQKNINAVKALAENSDVPVYFCLVPSLGELRPDLLPKDAPYVSQSDIIDRAYAESGATNIDMLGALSEHSGEYIFYRTDHHWTSLGAYYGYSAIMGAMGRDPSPLSNYAPRTVTEDFYGTVYSKSGISWVKPDEIEIFADQAEGTKVFNYVTGSEEESSLYDFAFLEKKDKYSMFLGGVSPLVKIVTENVDAPRLLIVRDSYTDSMVPFMQGDFSELHVMDLRYYRNQLLDSGIQEYIAENGIDEVLVCYSVGNFVTDVNVFLLGE